MTPIIQSMIGAAASRPPTYPHNWRELVNGSLEEKFVSIALGTFDELIQPDFIPSVEHIQFLIYLIINPSTYSLPIQLPLNSLTKLLLLHQPTSLSQAIPFHPSTSKSTSSTTRSDENPIYLQWDYHRSELHKTIWKTMKQCLDDGIWALLWEKKKENSDKVSSSSALTFKGKRKRNQTYMDEGDESEDEEDRKNDRVVSEQGWILLEWLIGFWEKDRLERNKEDQGIECSSLFLKQLPKPFDRSAQLPRNDASLPLAVLKSAYNSTTQGTEAERRKSCAVKLLEPVVDVTLGHKPPFHPASLSSSLVYILRSMSIIDLQDITRRLGISRHWRTSSHILSLLIEDLAGVRNTKLEERRKFNKNKIDCKPQNHFEVVRELDRPTSKYLFEELLLLTPVALKDGRTQEEGNVIRMIIMKIELMKNAQRHPYKAESLQDVKSKVKDDILWWERLRNTWNVSLQHHQGSKSIEKRNRLGEVLTLYVNQYLM
ncbi:uncharacterized protein L201_003891 [Kwoniella dendrophila CBS 6074]|uniref:F-box domain-containing protein n=1 Tax=Kwoniella dendrophila CBS 6074 TaxID=1295534 RepID=A0AAX4JU61_9TREE